MAAVRNQNSKEPHCTPSGLQPPPPLARLMTMMTRKTAASLNTLSQGVFASSSRMSRSVYDSTRMSMFEESERVGASLAPLAPPASSSPFPSPSPPSAAASSSSSSSSSCASSERDSRRSSLSSCSRSTSSMAVFCVSVSFLYTLRPFFMVRWLVAPSRMTSSTVRIHSGSTLFMNDPTSAPTMVSGSITRIRSQSTSGRSARGCRFGAFRIVFVMAPPKMVMLLRGMANLGWKPRTKM
mmetsp:Transcript_40442/g.126534  ORF Transcript_40442/g.126534 Transcript_40442/m.126534 type:complete len:239 (+) Transcript_40442:758-1474(+)